MKKEDKPRFDKLFEEGAYLLQLWSPEKYRHAANIKSRAKAIDALVGSEGFSERMHAVIKNVL